VESDDLDKLSSTLSCRKAEAHQSVGLIERYHQPLRRAYDELPNATKDEILQAAVKAVNDLVRPDGTLLVYGAYPRMSWDDHASSSVAARGRAMIPWACSRSPPNMFSPIVTSSMAHICLLR
jgi:hypothetical protein